MVAGSELKNQPRQSTFLRVGRRCWLPALFFALCASLAFAQYTAPYVLLQGQLSSSGGLPAANATLNFAPSQVFFVAGTSVIVATSQCATDVNGGVVSIGNPLTAPRVSVQYAGAMPAGNYYVIFTWYDQFGAQTLPSPEVQAQLTTTGELQILPPVGAGPPQATGMNVYIGTTPGGETYQGHTTATTAQYTQAVALTTGANPPSNNNTTCRVVANDAAWPTGTGYQVSLNDANGNTLFNYAQMWQSYGPGTTYNLSSGIPYYHGQVTYPVPVLTVPYNHNPQSISGPLSLTGYNLYNVHSLGVGTATPAWGVDVEGPALLGAVNANTGYLVGGEAGTAGQCLTSDGSYFDTPSNCVLTAYYQTVALGGTAAPQRPVLNFNSTYFTATDSASPAETTIAPVTTGSEGKLVTAAAAGTSTHCASWDASGGIGDAGTVCGAAGFTSGNNSKGYWNEDPTGHLTEQSCAQTATYPGDATITFPKAFTTLASIGVVPVEVYASGATGYVTIVASSITTTNFVVHQNNAAVNSLMCFIATGY